MDGGIVDCGVKIMGPACIRQRIIALAKRNSIDNSACNSFSHITTPTAIIVSNSGGQIKGNLLNPGSRPDFCSV